ncbi:hypothetical protein HHI36_003210 [Cryptolaemus montrouzieri]|uniref:Uncharacterized protein n=1 Tax=Cryptolaemus montrouzieri TaxID=559131 RepID=A0ABD2PDA3_9CUCU
MTNFRANPEEALMEFQNFIDKIAGCVSLSDVERITTILKVRNEWMNYNSNLLVTSLNTEVQTILEQTDLQTKLKNLNELEKGSKEIAWKPQTGNPDLISIEGDHLNKLKKKLMKETKQIKKESSLLQAEILQFRQQLQVQQTEMEHFINLTCKSSES